MPLFMDLHISPSGDIPIEDLIKRLKADAAYGSSTDINGEQ